MNDSQPVAATAHDSSGQPPRYVVLDTNVLVRLLILDFGVKEKVDLSYFLSKAGATLVLAHCQEDEFWRNAPKLWAEHVKKWRRVPADIKQAITQLVNGLASARKLSLLTAKQLAAADELGPLKTIVEQVRPLDYTWESFESFAEKAIAELRRAVPAGLIDVQDVEQASARRIQLHNPPCSDKKKRHWGDCVIWETVLRLAVRREGSVWFATTDRDFSSTDKTVLHPALQREVKAMGGIVRLFRERENVGHESGTHFRLLKEATRFVPEHEANSMRRFLTGLSSVSPEASWRDVVRALRPLSYREREILKLRFGIGDGYRYTQDEVAQIFGVSQGRISQIESKASRKFLNRMRGGDHATKKAVPRELDSPVEENPPPT